MPNKRINQLVKDLPFDKKLVCVGLFLMMVSQFMPWYQDKDSYSGDLFLGITGPLSLIGYTLLIVSAAGLGMIIAEALGKHLPVTLRRSSVFFLAFGLASFYLLLLSVTVYFHPKFGLNLTYKQSGFGMFFAFISASLITIGGYLVTRDKETLMKNFEEATRDPLEELSNIDLRKPKENLRTLKQVPSLHHTEPKKVLPMKDTEVFTATQVNTEVSSSSLKKPQPYRMDL